MSLTSYFKFRHLRFTALAFVVALAQQCLAQADTVLTGTTSLAEFRQMALANNKLAPHIDTQFLMASQKYMYLSSTIVREMARYGVDLGEFIPREIIDDFKNQINSRR